MVMTKVVACTELADIADVDTAYQLFGQVRLSARECVNWGYASNWVELSHVFESVAKPAERKHGITLEAFTEVHVVF
jgi:hypothetical protein